jgi:hypothetical protein
MGSYLPCDHVDEDIDGVRKGWATLDVVIANQMEDAMLGEHRCLIIQGPIVETKNKARGNTIPVNNLHHVTGRHASAFERC